MHFKNLQKDPVKYTFLLFLVGACARYDVNIMARFALSELLLFAYFPFALPNLQRYFQIKAVRVVATLCVVYLIGITITDFFIGNYFALYMRGAARPVVIGILFISLLDLTIRAPKGLPAFFLGLVVSGLQNYIYTVDFRAEFTLEGTYRDVAYRVTPLVLALAFFGGYLLSKISIFWTGVAYIITGIVFSQYGSRTSGILLLGTGMVFVVYRYLQARGIHRSVQVNIKSVAKYGLFAAVILVGILYAYTWAAPSGLLGERVRSKFEMQSATVFGRSPVGIVMRSRHQILSNLLMIKDKPILGHGSWPLEGPYIVEAITLLGVNLRENQITQGLLSRGTGHSIILGGGSNHGLIGLTFWLSLFYFIVKLAAYYLRFETRYSLLMVPLLIQLSILMWLTPLGTYDRIVIALCLAHYCLFFGLDRNFLLPRLKHGDILISNQQGIQHPSPPRR